GRRGFGSRGFAPRRWMPGCELEMHQGCRMRLFEIDLVLLLHWFEQLCERANRLGRAQEEKPFRFKGVMKRRHDPFLQTGFEIDQQVAATDEVDAREGRVAQEIL